MQGVTNGEVQRGQLFPGATGEGAKTASPKYLVTDEKLRIIKFDE